MAGYVYITSQAAVGSGNSPDLNVSLLSQISLDITTSAQTGVTPSIQFFWERKAADGIYYPLWQSAILTLAANTLSTSVGIGLAFAQSPGEQGRLRWVVGGTGGPTWTFTANIYGK